MTGLVFRKDGPWGGGKNAPLTEDDYDYTVWALVQQIAAKATAGVGIASIVQTTDSSEFWVALTDHTLLGPYNLPTVRFDWRGAWAPSVDYFTNDIVTNNGSAYMVLASHHSALTFDPGANDGSGHNYYGLIFSNPGNALPTGGAVGAVLTKASTTDYSTAWVVPTLAGLSDVMPSPAPTTGDMLYFNGSVWTYVNHSDIVGSPPALIDLSDVLSSPAPVDGYVPTWSTADGKFVFAAGGGGGAGSLSTLTDVSLGSTFDGDFLVYDSGSFAWKNKHNFDITYPINQLTSSVVTLGTTGSVPWNVNSGTIGTVTPTGDITLNAGNGGNVGNVLTLFVTTSGTSSWNITFNTNFISQGILATGTVTAKTFSATFMSNGTKWIEVSRTTAM